MSADLPCSVPRFPRIKKGGAPVLVPEHSKASSPGGLGRHLPHCPAEMGEGGHLASRPAQEVLPKSSGRSLAIDRF